MPKNVIDKRKLFIMSIPKTSENNLHEPWINDYGYSEGTFCLVNGLIGAKGMIFRAWVHKQAPQWLVLRINSADFLHCLIL